MMHLEINISLVSYRTDGVGAVQSLIVPAPFHHLATGRNQRISPKKESKTNNDILPCAKGMISPPIFISDPLVSPRH
jgi:hypothetical protein